MAQQALFGEPSMLEGSARRRASRRPGASQLRDRSADDPLEAAVAQLAATRDPLARARTASRIRDLAEELVASSIRDASRTGKTWREIGAALDIPFQTLHRRYGDRY